LRSTPKSAIFSYNIKSGCYFHSRRLPITLQTFIDLFNVIDLKDIKGLGPLI